MRAIFLLCIIAACLIGCEQSVEPYFMGSAEYNGKSIEFSTDGGVLNMNDVYEGTGKNRVLLANQFVMNFDPTRLTGSSPFQFVLVASDSSLTQKMGFTEKDMKIRLSVIENVYAYRLYDNLIEAELDLTQINRKNEVTGDLSFTVVSAPSGLFSVADTIRFENGHFSGKFEKTEQEIQK